MKIKSLLGRIPKQLQGHKLWAYSVGYISLIIIVLIIVKKQLPTKDQNIQYIRDYIESSTPLDKLSYLNDLSGSESFTIRKFPYIYKYYISPENNRESENNNFYYSNYKIYLDLNLMSYQTNNYLFLFDLSSKKIIKVDIPKNFPEKTIENQLKPIYKYDNEIYLLNFSTLRFSNNQKNYNRLLRVDAEGKCTAKYFHKREYIQRNSYFSNYPSFYATEDVLYYKDKDTIRAINVYDDTLKAINDSGSISIKSQIVRRVISLTAIDNEVFGIGIDNKGKSHLISILDKEIDTLSTFNLVPNYTAQFDSTTKLYNANMLYCLIQDTLNILVFHSSGKPPTFHSYILRNITTEKNTVSQSETSRSLSLKRQKDVVYASINASSSIYVMDLDAGFNNKREVAKELNIPDKYNMLNTKVTMSDKKAILIDKILNKNALRIFDDSSGHSGIYNIDSLYSCRLSNADLFPLSNNESYMIFGDLQKNKIPFYINKDKNNESEVFFWDNSIDWNQITFKVNAEYDRYYIIITTLLIVCLYMVGLIIIADVHSSTIFNRNKEIFDKIPTLRDKIEDIEKRVKALKIKSNYMLVLGILFGASGVMVSYVVFTNEGLSISSSWSDPRTLLSILRPAILLFFIESFSIFFLKQYKVIFNEYKLFYQIYLKYINYFHVTEIQNNITHQDNLSLIMISNLLNEQIELYEKNTKLKIDEFDNSNLLKFVEGMKNMKK